MDVATISHQDTKCSRDRKTMRSLGRWKCQIQITKTAFLFRTGSRLCDEIGCLPISKKKKLATQLGECMQESVTHFSTDLFAPEERTDAWRANCRLLWDCVPDANASRAAPLEGSLQSRKIGSAFAVKAQYSAMRSTRDTRRIAQSGFDQYFIHYYQDGSHIGYVENRELIGHSGDIRIIDLSLPYASVTAGGNSVALVLPRESLGQLPGGTIHGFVLQARNPLCQLLRSLLASINAPAFSVPPEEGPMIEETVAKLLRAVLKGEDEPALASNSSIWSRVLSDRITRFIDDKLYAPELGPDLLMTQFRISRTHLYRMFEASGGVAALIRQKRLDAAYRSLLQPTLEANRITRIGYEHGFASSSQFLRAFRARFGLAPSEVAAEREDMRSNVQTPPLLSELVRSGTVATTKGDTGAMT